MCPHYPPTQKLGLQESPTEKTNTILEIDLEWKIVQFKSRSRRRPTIHRNLGIITTENLNGKGKFLKTMTSRDLSTAAVRTLGNLALTNTSTPASLKSSITNQRKKVKLENRKGPIQCDLTIPPNNYYYILETICFDSPHKIF